MSTTSTGEGRERRDFMSGVPLYFRRLVIWERSLSLPKIHASRHDVDEIDPDRVKVGRAVNIAATN